MELLEETDPAGFDPIIDIWMPPILQWAVAPVLSVDIRFLVQIADSGGRHPAAPKGLGDVLYYSMRASSTLLPRRRSRSMIVVSKEIPLSLGTLGDNISGGSGEIAVMACRNFILPKICKPCLFYDLFNLRNLPYLSKSSVFVQYWGSSSITGMGLDWPPLKPQLFRKELPRKQLFAGSC